MFNAKLLNEVCERLDATVRSYSGRCMYGRECIGFVVSGSAAQFAFNLAVELAGEGDEGQELIEEFAGKEWAQDSMGLDSIVYVPRLAASLLEEFEEEEEDEEEDDVDENAA